LSAEKTERSLRKRTDMVFPDYELVDLEE